MPTRHILECPNCSERLLIDVEGAVGGVVQETLVLIDHRSAAQAEAAETPKGKSSKKGDKA